MRARIHAYAGASAGAGTGESSARKTLGAYLPEILSTTESAMLELCKRANCKYYLVRYNEYIDNYNNNVLVVLYKVRGFGEDKFPLRADVYVKFEARVVQAGPQTEHLHVDAFIVAVHRETLGAQEDVDLLNPRARTITENTKPYTLFAETNITNPDRLGTFARVFADYINDLRASIDIVSAGRVHARAYAESVAQSVARWLMEDEQARRALPSTLTHYYTTVYMLTPQSLSIHPDITWFTARQRIDYLNNLCMDFYFFFGDRRDALHGGALCVRARLAIKGEKCYAVFVRVNEPIARGGRPIQAITETDVTVDDARSTLAALIKTALGECFARRVTEEEAYPYITQETHVSALQNLTCADIGDVNYARIVLYVVTHAYTLFWERVLKITVPSSVICAPQPAEFLFFSATQMPVGGQARPAPPATTQMKATFTPVCISGALRAHNTHAHTTPAQHTPPRARPIPTKSYAYKLPTLTLDVYFTQRAPNQPAREPTLITIGLEGLGETQLRLPPATPRNIKTITQLICETLLSTITKNPQYIAQVIQFITTRELQQ